MRKLVILCVDGLDLDVAKEYNLAMEYEAGLSIPRELYHLDQPFTMDVWPSMFKGQIEKYPFPRVNKTRQKVRDILHALGFKWTRQGLNFGEDAKIVWRACPRVIDKMVLDDFISFTFNVPGVSPAVIFGGNRAYALDEYKTFKILATFSIYQPYEVMAFYTRIIDVYGHYKIPSEDKYNEVFKIAHELSEKVDVILLSDHGTTEGRHSDTAYLGANFPFVADNVLDIANIIKRWGSKNDIK